MTAQRVMITGVYGLIAGEIYNHLRAQPDRYDVYALARRRHPSDRVADGRALDIPDEKFFLSDLSDLDEVTAAMSGMDTVVHMAADPSGFNGWESVLNSNIVGAYNVFEGCKQAGVTRVVFASTIQVSMGYRNEEPYKSIWEGTFEGTPADVPVITHTDPTRTENIYSSSKVFGEALARAYADVHGMSCLCIRIGWVVKEDRPPRPDANSIWCSQRDIVHLTECCINASDDVRFDIFYGMSDNEWRWVDIAHAREVVGFVPQDRAEDVDSSM